MGIGVVQPKCQLHVDGGILAQLGVPGVVDGESDTSSHDNIGYGFSGAPSTGLFATSAGDPTHHHTRRVFS